MQQKSTPPTSDDEKGSDVSTSELPSIKRLADTARDRTAKELISSTLALILGVIASVIGSSGNLNAIGTSRFIYVGVAVALGTGLLVAAATYLIKGLATRKMDTDRIRNAVETAYFRALDQSILNPKSPKHLLYGHRPN